MRNRFYFFSAVLTLLLGGLFTPTFAEAPVSPAPPSPPLQKEATLVAAMIAEGANIWLPSVLIVKKGDTLLLTLRNVAKVEHGFAIDGFDTKEIIPAGETKTVTIKAESAGTFRFYCPLHKGHIGGQLLVQ